MIPGTLMSDPVPLTRGLLVGECPQGSRSGRHGFGRRWHQKQVDEKDWVRQGKRRWEDTPGKKKHHKQSHRFGSENVHVHCPISLFLLGRPMSILSEIPEVALLFRWAWGSSGLFIIPASFLYSRPGEIPYELWKAVRLWIPKVLLLQVYVWERECVCES